MVKSAVKLVVLIAMVALALPAAANMSVDAGKWSVRFRESDTAVKRLAISFESFRNVSVTLQF